MGILNHQDFIPENTINALPRRAKLSFAVHAARAVQPLVLAHIPYEEKNIEVETALARAEQEAAGASMLHDDQDKIKLLREWSEGSHWAAEVADSVFNSEAESAAAWAAQAAYTAARFVLTSLNRDDDNYWENYWAYNAVSDAIRAASVSEKSRNAFGNALKLDLAMLEYTAQAEGWTDNTIVPIHFFPARSEFDTATIIDKSTIVELASVIDARLIELFRRYPERLYDLEPRQFEELIAEVFDGFGFTVTLTKPTRDGGKDIIAVEPNNSNRTVLIECKHYRTRPVGLATVQRLLGVTIDENATKGILATTSDFTKPALECLRRNEWILEGRNFDGLLHWLNQYQRLKWAQILQVSNQLDLSKRLKRRA